MYNHRHHSKREILLFLHAIFHLLTQAYASFHIITTITTSSYTRNPRHGILHQTTNTGEAFETYARIISTTGNELIRRTKQNGIQELFQKPIQTQSDPTRDESYDLRRRFYISSILSGIVLIPSSFYSSSFAWAIVPEETNHSRRIPTNNGTEWNIPNLLHDVPTFVIVDGQGVPFMVVGEDAKITGYFFTSYDEANRILKLARESADKSILEQRFQSKKKKQQLPQNEELLINPWSQARISSVPLDFAVKLAKRGKIGGAYFRIAPSELDIQDALMMDSSVQELQEGKVPLFYVEDFAIATTKSKSISKTSTATDVSSLNTIRRSPLYFQKSQLMQDWKKYHVGEKKSPNIQVTELFAVLHQMTNSKDQVNDLQTIVFVPPVDSTQRAKECLSKMGKNSTFRLGERIVVL